MDQYVNLTDETRGKLVVKAAANPKGFMLMRQERAGGKGTMLVLQVVVTDEQLADAGGEVGS